MNRRVAAAVALMVASAVVAAVPAAGVASANATAAEDDELGTAISSFMQASAAEAEGDVENQMWVAGFERADQSARERMVGERTAALERQLERLEQERAELLNQSDDEITVQERAKAARLAARAEALREAIEQTDEAAAQAGVNAERIDELRTEASDLSGPEVAELAGGIADAGQGPPTDAPGLGPSGDRSNGGEANDRGNAPNGDRGGNADDRSADSDGQGDERGANGDERASGNRSDGDRPANENAEGEPADENREDG